jgi:hypothetical protein
VLEELFVLVILERGELIQILALQPVLVGEGGFSGITPCLRRISFLLSSAHTW